MTEQEWLTSNDTQAMLSVVYHDARPEIRRATPRQLRLFACACCRALLRGIVCPHCKGKGYHQTGYVRCDLEGIHDTRKRIECVACRNGRIGEPVNEQSLRAVEVAERYADGLATKQEARAARMEAYDVHGSLRFWACCHEEMPVHTAVTEFIIAGENNTPSERATQAALLRDIFGNPFRRVMLYVATEVDRRAGNNDSWFYGEWRTPDVTAIAQAIYEERRFTDMPILADALEDAGCTSAELLDHCRQHPSRHETWPVCPVCGGDGRAAFSGEKVGNYFAVECPGCHGSGLVGRIKPGPHVRGCWVLDLIGGRS